MGTPTQWERPKHWRKAVWGMIALVGLSLLAFVIVTAVTASMVVWEWPSIGLFILAIPGVAALVSGRRALRDKYQSD